MSGPSGCGKGTVLKELFKIRDDVCMSVSATSRAPREGETDGVNYFFVTREKFEQMIKDGELLEHASFCENYYGTPAFYVNEMLEKGKNVILEIEVQGAMQIREKRPEAVLVFIMPPSMEELERRLCGRGTESAEVIKKRLEAAKDEMSLAEKYDYRVVNNEVLQAAEEISGIIEKI